MLFQMFCDRWYDEPRKAKVGRPDRGDRAKVKAGRKAARRR